MSARLSIAPVPVRRPAIEVHELRVELPGGEDIVADVSFAIQPGEVLGLVGESGSGKTTVGMALLGFARGGAVIAGGTAFLDGDRSVNLFNLSEQEKLRVRGKAVAYVPQDPASALNPALRLRLQLSEVIEAHEPNVSKAETTQRIEKVMADVGLPTTAAFLDRFPHQLSGGQQQRIGIAMAVISEPRVIVLDEPTTGLDVTTQNRILDIVKRLCRDHGIAALHVTHDLSVVAHIADRVMVMYSGRIAELGPADQVFGNPLHPYTQALLGAAPELRYRTRLTTIPGRAARIAQRPRGCFFEPRCPISDASCTERPVDIEQAGADHEVRCLKWGSGAVFEPTRLPDPTPANPHATTANTVFEVQNFEVAYGIQKVLDGVNFTVERGECLAIVGESGSGKSTLSRAMIGLVPQQRGKLMMNFEPLASRARDRRKDQLQTLQYIFQSPHNSLNPRQTVGSLVGLVYDTFRRGERINKTEAIIEVLGQVGLAPDAMHTFPDELSGGERQRVAIARALMANPQILICDEITSALDVSVQAAVVNLLKDLQQSRGLTMLFITHNLALVRNLADRVLVLNRGKVVELGPVADVIDRPKDPYSRQLLENALVADVDARASAASRSPLRPISP